MNKHDAEEAMKIDPSKLRHRIDPSVFGFENTGDLPPLEGTIGQQRALEAIETGMDISAPGFNIYAGGRVGTGRNSTVRTFINEKARQRPAPCDWCYIYNFDEPDRPRALSLRAGMGNELAADMEYLLAECKEEIPKAFEGEQYERQRNEMMQKFQEQRGKIIEELRERAHELDHSIQLSPAGIAAVPLVEGEEISQKDFADLDKEKQEDLKKKNDRVQELIGETIARARKVEKEFKARAEELERGVGLFAVGYLVEQLTEKYEGVDGLSEYFDQVKEDIINNLNLFRSDEQSQQDPMGVQQQARRQAFNKYRVNVLVDNSSTEGAPVIEERSPTYYNLFGQIEYYSHFGGMNTDFTMIKAGSMLRANGGYITMQVLDLLVNPLAWEGLKRTLCTQQARIENMWEQFRPIPVASLEPEPIPLDVKVILVGSPILYELLYFLDKDFRRLFKIKADFDVEMERSGAHIQKYASFISSQCSKHGIPAFDSEASAKLVECGMRLAGRQDRLSTEFMQVEDIIIESAQQAVAGGRDIVTGADVSGALEARERRLRRFQDRLQDMIEDDEIIIDTEGSVCGQVNGLAVVQMGGYSFGRPSRISCISSIGHHGVVNIERESKMSGSIHDKGVMILSGYMANKFGQDKPLSLTATLCFEQSYSHVEGDSASCAELCVLLSGLAGKPLRQDIAVTGSVNQMGQLQPIGGVNEKIEGFYEVCRKKGLTGTQGVLIPTRNLKDLMLKDELVDAVRDGMFSVYAAENIEEGIELLTGMQAGERDSEGAYAEDSVFGRVDRRLREMAEILKEYGKPHREKENGEN